MTEKPYLLGSKEQESEWDEKLDRMRTPKGSSSRERPRIENLSSKIHLFHNERK